MAIKKKSKAIAKDPEPIPVAELQKAKIYVACTPIKCGKRFEIGEIIDTGCLSEKNIRHLLDIGAIKLKED